VRDADDAPAVTRISSSWTFFSKRVFPAVWFGFLAFFAFVGIATGAAAKNVTLLVLPLGMAIFGFFMMKRLVWDLADEVYDCGHALLVKNHGEEELVSLSNIMNVSVSTYVNPPRISLRLITPGKFGSEIAFSPVTGFRLNPFAKNPVAEDLIQRVYQAVANDAGGGFSSR
jgi:hypothetical protein